MIGQETEASGPIQHGTWDTRTRENSWWCARCNRWLRDSVWVTKAMHIQMHDAKEVFARPKVDETPQENLRNALQILRTGHSRKGDIEHVQELLERAIKLLEGKPADYHPPYENDPEVR